MGFSDFYISGGQRDIWVAPRLQKITQFAPSTTADIRNNVFVNGGVFVLVYTGNLHHQIWQSIVRSAGTGSVV